MIASNPNFNEDESDEPGFNRRRSDNPDSEAVDSDSVPINDDSQVADSTTDTVAQTEAVESVYASDAKSRLNREMMRTICSISALLAVPATGLSFLIANNTEAAKKERAYKKITAKLADFINDPEAAAQMMKRARIERKLDGEITIDRVDGAINSLKRINIKLKDLVAKDPSSLDAHFKAKDADEWASEASKFLTVCWKETSYRSPENSLDLAQIRALHAQLNQALQQTVALMQQMPSDPWLERAIENFSIRRAVLNKMMVGDVEGEHLLNLQVIARKFHRQQIQNALFLDK